MSKEVWNEVKDFFEDRFPCLILSTLIFELLILVIMIVFEYNKQTYTDYFYLFSIITLMMSTIYFAWHSLVKENAFELMAFLIMSSILNFHGIYQAIEDDELQFLHWFSIITFSIAQSFYYFSFYFAYSRFGWRAIHEINSKNANLIRAYKLFETFLSVLKLDFLLYFMTVAVYIFYVLVDKDHLDLLWASGGLAVLAMLSIVSLIGYFAARRGKKPMMVAYLILAPLGETLKVLMLVQVAVGRVEGVDLFIYLEALIIAAIDLAICIFMFLYMCIALQHLNHTEYKQLMTLY